MIGLDTNVLVRYIMQDDPKQSAKAGNLIDALDGTNRGFISLVSVVETVWLLSFCCDLNREQVAQALDAMLRTKQFVVEQTDQVL
jgi:predicted nucleic-acid-binding protein